MFSKKLIAKFSMWNDSHQCDVEYLVYNNTYRTDLFSPGDYSYWKIEDGTFWYKHSPALRYQRSKGNRGEIIARKIVDQIAERDLL